MKWTRLIMATLQLVGNPRSWSLSGCSLIHKSHPNIVPVIHASHTPFIVTLLAAGAFLGQVDTLRPSSSSTSCCWTFFLVFEHILYCWWTNVIVGWGLGGGGGVCLICKVVWVIVCLKWPPHECLDFWVSQQNIVAYFSELLVTLTISGLLVQSAKWWFLSLSNGDGVQHKRLIHTGCTARHYVMYAIWKYNSVTHQ